MRCPFIVAADGSFRFPFSRKVSRSVYGDMESLLPRRSAEWRRIESVEYGRGATVAAITLYLKWLTRSRDRGEQAAIHFAVGRCYARLGRLAQAVVYFGRSERMLSDAEQGASGLRLFSLQQLARIEQRQAAAAEAVRHSMALLEVLSDQAAGNDTRWEFLRDEALATLAYQRTGGWRA